MFDAFTPYALASAQAAAKAWAERAKAAEEQLASARRGITTAPSL